MQENTIVVQLKIDCNSEETEAAGWIETALRKAIEIEQLPSVEVSVVIVDNNMIQNLNNEYRKADRPTDVLSFPLWADAQEWKGSGLDKVPLGDIVISLTKAKEQAGEYAHSLERELAFLATHGFLHLLGYIHDTEEEEERMIKRQELILSEIGLKR